VGNSYRVKSRHDVCFERFADGTLFAYNNARRSGAQRGAPENNFGQRFSWAPRLHFRTALPRLCHTYSLYPAALPEALSQCQRFTHVNTGLTQQARDGVPFQPRGIELHPHRAILLVEKNLQHPVDLAHAVDRS
jgi:hypothetical protein